MEAEIARIHAFIIHVITARDCTYQGVDSKVHTDQYKSKNLILRLSGFEIPGRRHQKSKTVSAAPQIHVLQFFFKNSTL